MNTEMSFNGNKFTIIFDIHGDPWFKAKDIAEAVGYVDTDQAVRNNVSAEDKCSFDLLSNPVSIRGHPKTIFINECGVYALIFTSFDESAKVFKCWITHEVLPTLRKSGEYKLRMELSIKESTIASLTRQIEGLKLEDDKKHHQFILVKKNCESNIYPYYVLRIQKCNKEFRIRELKEEFPDMEILLVLNTPNSIVLYNKMKELLDIKWDGNNFGGNMADNELVQSIVNIHKHISE
jgi:prophage antirepressor-like protein